MRQQTIALPRAVWVESWGSVAGPQEGKGPLGGGFDLVGQDGYFGEATWEQAESAMQREALALALNKGGVEAEDVDVILGGDLLNQCIATTFALRGFGIPALGLYNACATMGEALALGALLLGAGYGTRGAAMVSSHFSTAERQYRMPVPYGSQRPPTAQWTATAAGCVLLSAQGKGVRITHVTLGKLLDFGLKDANNMGAAMAPAAADTLAAFFRETGTRPEDFDGIFTGDLGALGRGLAAELLREAGYPVGEQYQDCGVLLYDRQRQDMHMGGSGCGCSAAVLCSHILPKLQAGQLHRVVFAPTGAMLSPTSTMQGQSIPSICHALCLTAE